MHLLWIVLLQLSDWDSRENTRDAFDVAAAPYSFFEIQWGSLYVFFFQIKTCFLLSIVYSSSSMFSFYDWKQLS